MSQELAKAIELYCSVFHRTMDMLEIMASELRDARLTPVIRIMETMDPKAMKLVDYGDANVVFNKTQDIVDISASIVFMAQNPTVTSGEALTVGCVIEHIKMIDEVINNHLKVDPKEKVDHLVDAYCPQLAKRLSEAVLENGKLIDRSMDLLRANKIALVFDTINKQFDINTPTNRHFKVEVCDGV